MKNNKNKPSGDFEFSKEFPSQFWDQEPLKQYMRNLRCVVVEEMPWHAGIFKKIK